MAKRSWKRLSVKALPAILAAATVMTATPVLADELADVDAAVVEAQVAEETVAEEAAEVAEETAAEEAAEVAEEVAAEEAAEVAEEAAAEEAVEATEEAAVETAEEAEIVAATYGWEAQADGRYKYYGNGDAYYANSYNWIAYAPNGDVDYAYYGFDYDGYLITGAWYNFTDSKYSDKSDYSAYYFDSNGKQADGVVVFDGVEYLFSGGNYTNHGYAEINGENYWCIAEEGVVTTKISLKEDGWKENNSYYVKDGYLVRGQIIKIDGAAYGFDYTGKRVINDVMHGNVEGDTEYRTYGFDADGNMIVNGELTITNGYGYSEIYRFGADGKGINGPAEKDGVKYLYNDGSLVKNSYDADFEYDATTGKYIYTYYFGGKDGVYIGSVTDPKEGWNALDDGNFTYFEKNESGNYLSIMYSGLVEKDGSIKAINNGLMVRNDTYYYYDNKKDINYFYGFDQDGNMIKDAFLTLTRTSERWNSDTQQYEPYEYEAIYYFGADGMGVTGKTTIDGVDYFFRDGQLYTNSSGYVWKKDADGRTSVKNGAEYYYRTDADGKLITFIEFDKVELDKWVKSYGEYYYVTTIDYDTWMNGEKTTLQVKGLVANKTKVIGGKTYGFDYSGRMYKNQRTSFDEGEKVTYTNENGEEVTQTKWTSYYFDENGVAKTGWFTVYNQYNRIQYYADEKGRLADGLVTYNGKKYYFSYGCNYLDNYCSDTRYGEKIFVYSNETGEAVIYEVLQKNGVNAEDHWVKITSGKNAGKYAYVKDGSMAYNQVMKIGDKYYGFGYDYVLDDAGYAYRRNADGYYNYYRFNDKGEAITGWYKNTEDGYYYYYHEDGTAAEGSETVDGTLYYFNYQGRMELDCVAVAGDKLCVIDAKGKVTATYEAAKVGANWKQINGNYYYSDGTKFLCAETATIGGKTYYFNYEGVMVSDSYAYVASLEGYAFFNSKGVMVTNGWAQGSDGKYYYAEANGLLKSGFVTLGKKDYYFEPALAVNTYIEIEGVVYKADANGALSKAKDGWAIITEYYDYNYGYGNYYTVRKYVSGGKFVTGWKKISGVYYYFAENGEATTGITTIEDKMYAFSDDGVMLTGWATVNGGSDWVYTEKSGALKTGWVKDGKTYYYFDPETGYMATGLYYVAEEDTLYKFAASGKYESKITGTGLQKDSNKNLYYITDAHQVYVGLKEVNGKMYYFTEDGAKTNEFYGNYYFGKDGAMVKNDWVLMADNNYAYMDKNGIQVSGEGKKIGGKWYYFDYSGRMVTRDTIVDGKIYRINTSGVWTKTETPKKNTWYTLNGLYYYYEKDAFAVGLRTIGGKMYYFNYSGSMVYNGTVSYAGKRYFADKSGVIQKNKWVSYAQEVCDEVYETSYYYASKDGSLLTGLQTINGKKYYFSDYGYMYTANMVSEDGTALYEINKSGVVTKTVKATSKNQWVKSSDGKWYYTIGGKFAYGAVTISGKQYYFGYDMYKDSFISGVGYANAKGVIQTDGWVKAGDYYRYLIGGKSVTGAMKIDGKYYYFGNSNYTYNYYSAVTAPGLYYVDGAYYWYEGNNGKRTKQSLKEGWNMVKGTYYYVKNGCLATGATNIDGKYYYFSSDGKWLTNTSYSDGYLDKDGKFVKNQMVTTEGGYKRYFAADGDYVAGVQTIGGKKYTFTEYGYMLK